MTKNVITLKFRQFDAWGVSWKSKILAGYEKYLPWTDGNKY
jgi:hypothetical protein